jgi:hypothetical protein
VIKFVVLYRYEIWSLILRKENIHGEFENGVLRKTLMSKGKEKQDNGKHLIMGN